jgi:DNA-directed RNA polymerase subunit RPC12/RpoP
MTDADAIQCETCRTRVAVDDTIRRRTYGDLDPDRWQTLCCPDCGTRLKTVLVRDE